MPENIRDLVRRTIATTGLSNARLSEEAGFNYNYVSELLANPRQNPRVDTVERLEATCRHLLSDAGHESPPAETVAIREKDVRAGAGNALEVSNENTVAEWRVPRTWLNATTTAAPRDILIITIYGDSMLPTLAPGDRVMVDTSDVLPSPPGIFALWDGIGLVAKRLEHVLHSDPPTLRIKSDNEQYMAYSEPLDLVTIRGRIIGKWLWT